MLSWICLLAVLLNFYRFIHDLSERFFDLGHQIGGIHAVAGWNPRSSHPGFSNLRKADPGRYFGVSIWPSGI